jgi:protocatechuate 3,4-dioxygenase, alpha subunit
MDLAPTPSQTVGPFFHFCLTNDKSCVRSIAGPQVRGERVLLTVRVLDGNGEAVPDAIIEIWQANSEGKYNHPDDAQQKTIEPGFLGFGRMGTAENGTCEFETIRPGRVPGTVNVAQAPHLNVAVFGRGMLKQLYTRIYFAGNASNQEDPVLSLVPPDRKDTLMAYPDAARPGGWRFDMRLQGEGETVFFDV